MQCSTVDIADSQYPIQRDAKPRGKVEKEERKNVLPFCLSIKVELIETCLNFNSPEIRESISSGKVQVTR